MWHGARRYNNAAPRDATKDRRQEDVRRERPAGQRGAAIGESGKRSANRARNASIFECRGAEKQPKPHMRMPPDRSETRKQRNVVWHAARSHRLAQHRPMEPRTTDAKKTLGESDRPGYEDCRRKIKSTI